jgi:large subunit ribosomal protein L5
MKQEELIKKSFEKVVVNTGVGRLSQAPQFEEKILPELMKEVALITGQKPEVRRARESISGFKLRKNQIVGLRVVLRRDRMADFIKRLIHAVLPRVRDFRGIDPGKVDRSGSLNVGIKEQVVFPEIVPEESRVSFGVQITFVPRKKDREEALVLYREVGVPLKK